MRTRVALLLVGVALVVAFVARIGPHEIARQIGRAGPKVAWMLVPYAIGTAVGALPWGLLLSHAERPRLRDLLIGRFAASSANSMLPFFGLAGEPARLLWLAPHARAHGLAAVVVDRILYNSANGFLLVAGALVAWLFTPLPDVLAIVAFVAGWLMLLVTPFAFWAARRLGVAAKIQRFVRKRLRRTLDAPGFGAEVDGILVQLLRRHRGSLWSGAGLHLLGRAAVICEAPLGLWILDGRASAEAAIVIAVVPIALSVVFSSVPSQVGVQEGAQALLASTLGLDAAVVLALVLLQRFRQLVFAVMLPLFLAAARPKAPSG